MTPQEIKAQLVLRSVTQAAIAYKYGCTRQFVNKIINQKARNRRLAKLISRAINLPPSKVFPWFKAA